MPNAIEFVSDSFLRRVFQYFGFTSASFVMASGVLLSGLGLRDFINPTVWLVASGCALILAYALRHYIGARFLPILLLCLATAGGILFLIVSERLSPRFVTAPLRADPLTALLIEFLPLLLLSFCAAVALVAYHKHDVGTAEDVTPSIRSSLSRQIVESPLYYRSFTCHVFLEFDRVASRVRIDSDIRMVVRNRSAEPQAFAHRYPRITSLFRLHEVRVDEKPRDIRNPRYHAGDAVHLTETIPPKGECTVQSRMTEVFPDNGSELYTCYVYPAEEYHLSVVNHDEDVVTCWIELLNNDPAESESHDTQQAWTSRSALLPYQGARLVWISKLSDDAEAILKKRAVEAK